ncbi:MAG: molybdate ABC transporter substrate-binding protein [Lentisphaerota bacterium]
MIARERFVHNPDAHPPTPPHTPHLHGRLLPRFFKAFPFLLFFAASLAGAGASMAAADKESYPGRSLEVFAGSASKPPTEELAARFKERTGAECLLHFGGSGQMLTQMKLTGRGDVYFPGSSDYMEAAKRDGLVVPESERRIVYLVPAINVVKGNPKNIQTLADLARPGIRVGIARPDAVCVGLYAVEVLERAGLADQVRSNIVTYAESCDKTAQMVSLGAVDAVIGWRVFEFWDPEHIQTVRLPPDQVPRMGYIPIAVAASCRDRELAEAFIAFAGSEEGLSFYKKWHYLSTEGEARQFTLPNTPVGGEWPLPAHWK